MLTKLESNSQGNAAGPRPHPRTVGWFGTTAVAMGGINQSLFLLSALFIGQGAIPGQGSAAVVLLGIGLLLSWAALPGWTELVMMYPNRVGGISATCAEAFRPYSPILANLTGVCYWCGWAPACGLTSLLAASVLNQWCLPWLSVPVLAVGIVLIFTFVSLCGVKWIMRLVMPMATISAVLAFLSAVIPACSGAVDWHQAFTFKLTVPFDGWFGQVTSVMAGLYLVCYAAPAFEQAACHVGETIDPNKNVPRAMFASAGLASLFFIVLPVIWLGALGPESIAKDLAVELGPTFAPLLGGVAKAAAVWFIVLSAFHASIAPLAGAARVLAQLAEDGLLPEFMARRARTDAPWVATLLTAATAILIIFVGMPLWLIAATNFTYLIGIGLPSVAVWLLRRNQPQMLRPYRAPRGTIVLGLLAAGVWAFATILGFQQFGLPTVLAGVGFACLGAVLYAWRKAADRRDMGLPILARTLHLKLTGAMLLVLLLDGAGYLIAISNVPARQTALMAVLADIFVLVALLTMVVGLILPGMIAHAAVEVSAAADKLVKGTLADFTRAMRALAAGDLDAAKASFDLVPVVVHSRDEIGDMALSFNRLQVGIGYAATGLEGARKGLQAARDGLESRVEERTSELQVEVTERRRSEQAVMESQRFLQSTLDALSAHIAILDESGVIIAVNAVWNRFAQANAQAAARLGVGVNYLGVSHRSQGVCAEEAPAVERGIRAVLAGEAEEFQLEYPCHSPKEKRWFIVRVTRFGDEGTRRIVVAHENITERKQAEVGLGESEGRYRSLVQALPAAVYTCDAQGRITLFNEAAAALWGREPELGKDLWCGSWKIYSPDGAPIALADCPMAQTLREGRSIRGREIIIERPDGTRRFVQPHPDPILNANGRVIGAVNMLVDLTTRKEAEDELEKLHRQLLDTSRQAGMAEVATSVLHNVGNVLNSVNVSCSVISDSVRQSRIRSVATIAELLREHAGDLAAFFTTHPTGRKLPDFFGKLAGRLSEEQTANLGELQLLSQNIEHIKEIVAVQQSHAGNIGGVRETLPLADLVEDALRLNDGTLSRHRIEVIREYSEVPPVALEKHKVLQILVNLLRNAKHALTDSGREDKRLVVRIARRNGHLAVSVSDNGIGIAPENLTRIFAHGFTTRKNGHGFGLHSGVLAAQEMGGMLTVQSDGAGAGATFTLALPIGGHGHS